MAIRRAHAGALAALACLWFPVLTLAASDLAAQEASECVEAGGCAVEVESEEAGLLQVVSRTRGLEATAPALLSSQMSPPPPPPPPTKPSNAVPVFVMMSLRLVSPEGKLNKPWLLRKQLKMLKKAGVHGVMSDCWWGITEPQPEKYDFSAYRKFVRMAWQEGLKVQFVTSFHQCGDPAGADSPTGCYIPLPDWVRREEGIWFKNANGHETKAYISLFANNVEVVGGRTPKQMYRDWLCAFAKEFSCSMDHGTIVEIMLGMGTDGELKYPSYENGAWSYPGIGMPQAFDQYAKKSLMEAAKEADAPSSWGLPPVAEETGDNNAFPNETCFYREGGSYTEPRGKFFLEWYSGALRQHASDLLQIAREELGWKVPIAGKISGVHWWYKYPSHAAELNAGYYNANGVDGYGLIADAFKQTGTRVDFTCLEMTDASQNPDYDCGPQELVAQVQGATRVAGLAFTGENALSFYDAGGYNQMLVWKPPTGYVSSITYLRLSDDLLKPRNLQLMSEFCAKMGVDGWVSPFSITND